MRETQETWVRSLCREDPLEEGMATHSSMLAWRIPWTEEPGGLQSMGLQRVGHDGMTEYDLAIQLLGKYVERPIIQKDRCPPVFTEELFTISKAWKQLKCPPADEWIKEGVVHIYNGIITQPWKRKACHLQPRGWTQRLSHQVSQRKTKIYGITYMQNLNDNTKELIYKTERDSQTSERELPSPRGKREERGWSWGWWLEEADYYM